MPALLVVAHAPLASALAAVARHVYPDCGSRLGAVDVRPEDTPEQVAAAITAAIEPLSAGGEALILVDSFGATPCNVARSLADGQRVRVVAGANVPMLWRTLCYADRPLAELVQRALDGGGQGVMHVPPETRRQNQSSPASARHDPEDRSHQQ